MIELRKPVANLISSYLESIEEMRQIGEIVWEGIIPKAGEDPLIFVERLNRAEMTPEPGLVAQTTYWAVSNNQVVGRIALRHQLTEKLKEFGGHIGYEVRPSARRKGIATEMLRLLLQTPKSREIGRLLVTCAPDNTASNKAILANGGILERTAFVEAWHRDTNYYWIDLRQND